MKKTNVIKNTVMLYGMSIAKLIFPLLTLPYLTRILTKDTYGAVAYVKTVMQYMQITIDFGFMLSGTKDVVKVREDVKQLGVVVGDILLARVMLSVAAFAVLVVMTYALPILRSYRFYTLLSFGTVFLSVFLFDYLFRGLEKMQVITQRFILMKGLSTALTFVFVKGDGDILFIPLLDLAGSLLAILLVMAEIKKLGLKIQVTSLRSAVQKLKESAVYFLSNIATTAFGALNTVLIGAILPASDVADWSVSMQLIGAVQTMYNPIVDGVYPEMVKSKDIHLIKRLLIIFMPLISAGCIFSFAIARFALVIVGGAQYAGASTVFRCLLPVLFFSFPAMVLGWPTLGAIGKSKEVTFSTIVTAVFQVAGLAVLAIWGHFSLVPLAILRGVTEMLLLIIRAYFCVHFRREYK